MEKETVKNIIIQDIKELETLISNFPNRIELSKGFINLANNKLANIAEELEILATCIELDAKRDTNNNNVTPKPENIAKPTESKIEPKIVVIEPEEPKIEEKIEIVEVPKIEIVEPVKPEIVEHVAPKPEPQSQILQVSTEPPVIKPTNAVLGEQITKVNTIYDTYPQKNDHTQQYIYEKSSAKDLKSSIGIGDKIYFIKELFDKNQEKYDTTMEIITKMDNADAIKNYLNTNFKWDKNNEAAILFIQTVTRGL